MYSRYSEYGWRARLGLIVPSGNVVMEPEFQRMLPPGVSLHTARVLVVGKTSVESYMDMAEATTLAATQLATAEVSSLAYGCTSGSIVAGDEEVTRRLKEAAPGIPVVTTATAAVEALRAMGLRRIAVATPYVPFVDEAEKRYLEERGFEVTRILGLELGYTEPDRRMMGRIPSGYAYRIAREADTPDAEGLFISCTGFSTIPIIEQLEADTGKPVVTSNQATFWASLRRAGLSDRLEGFGRLFAL